MPTTLALALIRALAQSLAARQPTLAPPVAFDPVRSTRALGFVTSDGAQLHHAFIALGAPRAR